jgi:uncharacterized protein YkwD
VLPSLANVAAYVALIASVEFVLLILAHELLRRIPGGLLHSRFNQVAGAILGGFEIVLIVAIGLAVFINLPISAAQKKVVQNGTIAANLANLGNRMQSFVNLVPGNDLTQTLNLLTVDPESHETVSLGFTTTNVHVNEAAEERMLSLVNQERTGRGLNALKLNVKARQVARAHSQDMFARGYFSHITPEGLDPFERMRRGGVAFDAAGENLALAPTLDLAHTGLMNSPGHRANILSPDFNTVGIGVIDGGPYGLMITQDFTD